MLCIGAFVWFDLGEIITIMIYIIWLFSVEKFDLGENYWEKHLLFIFNYLYTLSYGVLACIKY